MVRYRRFSSAARESASNRCVFVVSSLAGIVLKLPRVSAPANVSMIVISVIVGSTREGRFSEKPAKWILQHLKKREGVDVRLLDLRDFPMPFTAQILVAHPHTGMAFDLFRYARHGDAAFFVPDHVGGSPDDLRVDVGPHSIEAV
jgi:NADPH-dependent FMN reductase